MLCCLNSPSAPPNSAMQANKWPGNNACAYETFAMSAAAPRPNTPILCNAAAAAHSHVQARILCAQVTMYAADVQLISAPLFAYLALFP
ncbi:unnamed protein product [Periconia digitata]|uniref:Uncharacterized protein n=1 Tax=Periconia digitata TaxID=1303443 RepID=A0A9W4UA97_9PLEO|nr:unnamed protein product [Periconia digitata]